MHTKISGQCKRELDRAGFKVISKYSVYPNWLATDKIYALSEWLNSDYKPHIEGLKKFLTKADDKNIKQDAMNPYIFTVKEGGKKAYWFFNVITHQYQQLIEYVVKNDKNASEAVIDSGGNNTVYFRDSAPSLAIRKSIYLNTNQPSREIERSNLMLSLLYSMENHQQFSKYINLGFIKSTSKQGGHIWKMLVPTIQGATLTQIFGIEYHIGAIPCKYNRRYGHVPPQRASIVRQAKDACVRDIHDGVSLSKDLEDHYQKFCDHAKKLGIVINHFDLTPYNVMYNLTSRCLTIIDGDSWQI